MSNKAKSRFNVEKLEDRIAPSALPLACIPGLAVTQEVPVSAVDGLVTGDVGATFLAANNGVHWAQDVSANVGCVNVIDAPLCGAISIIPEAPILTPNVLDCANCLPVP